MIPRVGEAKLKGVIKLGAGSKVQVQGLKNQTELNGLVGSLLKFDAVKMRWGVELPDGRHIALKMANLIPTSSEVAPAVEVPLVGPVPADLDGASTEATNAAAPSKPPPKLWELAAAPASDYNVDAAAASAKKLWEDLEAQEAAHALETDAAPTPFAVPTPTPGEALLAADAALRREASGYAGSGGAGGAEGALDEGEWPVLPTSEATRAKIQSGCWWEGGSAAKRFTEQLLANDPMLVSVVLVPPKRFNEDDAREICDALEANTFCEELIASGHVLSADTLERLARMLSKNTKLRKFSIGESSLGEQAGILFNGLAQNVSITSLDLEHKGLTLEACRALAAALQRRQGLSAPPWRRSVSRATPPWAAPWRRVLRSRRRKDSSSASAPWPRSTRRAWASGQRAVSRNWICVTTAASEAKEWSFSSGRC